MSNRALLAKNLKALLDHHKMPQVAVKGVSQATVGRLLRQEVAADLDTLTYLAQGFGLEVWQLLSPNLDPANLPARVLSKEEAARTDHFLAAAEAIARYKN